MLSEANFFSSDPTDNVYDLYSFVMNAEEGPRLNQAIGTGHSLRVETEAYLRGTNRNLVELPG